jgi:hypothetical protein
MIFFQANNQSFIPIFFPFKMEPVTFELVGLKFKRVRHRQMPFRQF